MARDPMFTLNDIRDAAEDFIETLADLAEGRLTDSGAVVMWEQGDRDSLAEALTDAGIAVLRDNAMTFRAALNDPRTCKGCTASLAGMRVDAEWCSRACKMRTQRRGEGAQSGNHAPRRPGGLQVAFGPACAAVADEFRKAGLTMPKARAVTVLRRALSPKQRDRLDAARALPERSTADV